MSRTLKFRDLWVGKKFVGTLIGLGAPKKPQNFIKICLASSVRLTGSRWNAVRLSDGDLCAFAPTAEVTPLGRKELGKIFEE
ncbi:MAG: hypothetical protein A3D57_01575 [Candidatus Sungbacteria bacterium RIFCSPHIGHO2_02_FULL_46_12]|nr:MAG: hypothetical protein A3D57_01575 [Candidatus Sungbacteria bacterium RIFCSPHIGHO2_02_FULL_46_12]